MPNADANKIEYILLSTISASEEPMGAGALKDILEGQDIEVGEATVGRLLRQIEKKGFLERIGFRGRRLTESGDRRLKELSSANGQLKSVEELISSMKSGGCRHLKDLLVARRAVESETAYLAAQNATDGELFEIRKSLLEMDELKTEGKSIAATDAPFHVGIARASGNRILEFALKMFRHNQDYSPLLEYIRTLSGSMYQSDHWKIYRAIEARNPEEARRLMVLHIGDMIREIEDYERLAPKNPNLVQGDDPACESPRA